MAQWDGMRTDLLTKLAQPLRRGEFEDLRGLVINEPIGAAFVEKPTNPLLGSIRSYGYSWRGPAS